MIFTGLLSGVIRLCGDDEEEDSCKGGPAPSSDADVGAVVPMLSLLGWVNIKSFLQYYRVILVVSELGGLTWI